jgi:hypothetical protein
MTFSQGKMEFYVIYAYLWSILASNPNNPKEEVRDLPKHRDVQVKGIVVDGCRRQQKIYPTPTFVAPRKVGQKKTVCLVLHKDHDNERLNESKLEN